MTENPFDQPTYIVLNAPDSISQAVKALRRRFDPKRAELPVEITIAGSSGLGVIAPGQSPEEVFTVFDRIVAATPPMEVRFGPMKTFPETSIFFLDVSPTDKICHLQDALRKSNIRFVESPFPFQPHCTVRLRGEISDDEIKKLLSFQLQSPDVTLNTVSIYNHDETMHESRLLHRANLGEPIT